MTSKLAILFALLATLANAQTLLVTTNNYNDPLQPPLTAQQGSIRLTAYINDGVEPLSFSNGFLRAPLSIIDRMGYTQQVAAAIATNEPGILRWQFNSPPVGDGHRLRATAQFVDDTTLLIFDRGLNITAAPPNVAVDVQVGNVNVTNDISLTTTISNIANNIITNSFNPVVNVGVHALDGVTTQDIQIATAGALKKSWSGNTLTLTADDWTPPTNQDGLVRQFFAQNGTSWWGFAGITILTNQQPDIGTNLAFFSAVGTTHLWTTVKSGWHRFNLIGGAGASGGGNSGGTRGQGEYRIATRFLLAGTALEFVIGGGGKNRNVLGLPGLGGENGGGDGGGGGSGGSGGGGGWTGVRDVGETNWWAIAGGGGGAAGTTGSNWFGNAGALGGQHGGPFGTNAINAWGARSSDFWASTATWTSNNLGTTNGIPVLGSMEGGKGLAFNNNSPAGGGGGGKYPGAGGVTLANLAQSYGAAGLGFADTNYVSDTMSFRATREDAPASFAPWYDQIGFAPGLVTFGSNTNGNPGAVIVEF